MKNKWLRILMLVFVLALLADTQAVYAHRGRGRNRVIFKFHSPYYYPYSRYCYNCGYSYYNRPSYYPKQSYNVASLSVIDIVNLSSQATPDDVIISEIQRTNSFFSLNAEIIDYLKANKVSDRVIDYMLVRRK